MRVLFTTWAWGSHYFPTVPLGWALRAAGHEVVVASAPGFTDVITGSGLPAVAVGRDLDIAGLLGARKGDEIRKERETGVLRTSVAADLTSNGDRRRQARDGAAVFAAIAEEMADDTVAFARAWQPDVVVYEPTTFAGPLAARVLGVPAVRHLWTVDFTRRIDEFEDELLGPLAARFGLSGLDALGDVWIDPCPAAMQLPGGKEPWPIRYVPYNGRAVLPDWLRVPAERPRALLTWGTSINGMGLGHLNFVPAVLEALAEADVELLLTAGPEQREALGALPANVRVIDPVALHLVLPTVDSVVHQGGGGTMMTALCAGVPQLCLPHLPDQILNSRRLAEAGGGKFVLGAELTPDAIAAAFTELRADGRYRAGAGALRDEMAARPSALEVADRLGTYVARGSREMASIGR